jgi:hypothetical protein
MKKSEREGTTPLYIHKGPTPKNTLNPDGITTLNPDDIIP